MKSSLLKPEKFREINQEKSLKETFSIVYHIREYFVLPRFKPCDFSEVNYLVTSMITFVHNKRTFERITAELYVVNFKRLPCKARISCYYIRRSIWIRGDQVREVVAIKTLNFIIRKFNRVHSISFHRCSSIHLDFITIMTSAVTVLSLTKVSPPILL